MRFLANERKSSLRMAMCFTIKRGKFKNHRMIHWMKALSYVKTSLVKVRNAAHWWCAAMCFFPNFFFLENQLLLKKRWENLNLEKDPTWESTS